MRHSHSQIQVKPPNFTPLMSMKLQRSTMSVKRISHHKKVSSKRRHQIFAESILEQIITNVVTKSKISNVKENMILQFVDQSVSTVLEIHCPPKQDFFGRLEQQPQPQRKPQITLNTNQSLIPKQQLHRNSIKPIISKRQTFLKSNTFELLPVSISLPEDQYINQLRNEYLKVLQDAKIKINLGNIKNKKSIISKLNSDRENLKIISNKSSATIIENTILESSDRKQQLDKSKSKKPRIASYSQLPEQQEIKSTLKKQQPVVKPELQPLQSNTKIKSQVKSKSITNVSKPQMIPSQIILKQSLIQNQKQHSLFKDRKISLLIVQNGIKSKSMISELRLPSTNVSEPIKSKRITDKQMIHLLDIQHKRISLPVNVLKVDNQQKVQPNNIIEVKKYRKKNKTMNSEESNSKSPNNKQNKPLKSIRYNNTNNTNNNPPLKKIIINKKIIIKSNPQNYLLRPNFNTHHNSLSVSDIYKTQSTHLNTSYNQIKTQFISTNDSLSKHQIIQLLQALDTPHNISFQKAFSPIPLRLEKIRKYINNTKNKNEQMNKIL